MHSNIPATDPTSQESNQQRPLAGAGAFTPSTTENPSLGATAPNEGFLLSGAMPRQSASQGAMLPDGGVPYEGQKDEHFLIQGNKVTPLSTDAGLRGVFDDFTPDYRESLLGDRLDKYARAHGRALEMAGWIGTNVPLKTRKAMGVPSVKADLENCGSWLMFRHYYTVDQVKLSSMCSCKRHLLCPLCAVRRAAKCVKAYMDRLQVIQAQDPTLKAYLVTYTVKDGPDLQERFNHIHGNLSSYLHRRSKANTAIKRISEGLQRSSGHRPVEANKAQGGVGSYEIKRGSGSGEWHPHAHWIWLCHVEPDMGVLRDEWRNYTGDSHMVDVTPFHDQENVSSGFLEVFKYALKFSSLSTQDNWQAFSLLQRRRLISSFGVFRGVEVPEQMTDEIEYDDLPYIELVYRWLEGKYKLHDRSTSQQHNAPA